MVCEDGEGSSKEIHAPFFECVNDGKQLLFVDRIVELRGVELLRLKGDRSVFQSVPTKSCAPMPLSEASHMTKILLLPMFSWSIEVRQLQLTTRFLIASKAR